MLCHCEEGALPDEAISWLHGDCFGKVRLAMTLTFFTLYLQTLVFFVNFLDYGTFVL